MRKPWFAAVSLWLGISLILGLLTFLASIYFFPEWKSSQRNLVALASSILVVLLRLLGPITTWVLEQRRERERNERTRWAFKRETDHSVRLLKPPLRGIPDPIEREETGEISEQLGLSRPVLLTGEAGSGKSGIAVALASHLGNKGILPLLIDARRLGSVRNSADFTAHFELSEPLISAIQRQGKETGMRLVFDQIDTMVGAESIAAMIDLLIDCAGLDGVQVVAVSRRRVAMEERALRPLMNAGFQEIVCRPLTPEVVGEVLAERGLTSPTRELLEIGSNTLNLEIVCEIVNEAGTQQLDDFQDEIALWERYRGVIRERADRNPGMKGDEFLAEAIRLAIQGLSSPDRSFQIPFPLTSLQARLVSSSVIVQDYGRTYRFQHEKLQDYLYAWDASERGLMPKDVYDEIGDAHVRNVLVWMRDRYQELGCPHYGPFLEELLSG